MLAATSLLIVSISVTGHALPSAVSRSPTAVTAPAGPSTAFDPSTSHSLWLPFATAGPMPDAATALAPPDPSWRSEVLEGVPAYPGSRLIFYDRVDTGPKAGAAAWYEATSADDDPDAIRAWYGMALPRYGWTRTDADTWRTVRSWLRLRVEKTPDDPARIVIEGDPGLAAPGSTDMVFGLQLPTGMERLRFDPQDLFADELRSPSSPTVALASAVEMLTLDGWAPGAGQADGFATTRRLQKDAQQALLAAWPGAAGGSVLGIGRGICSPGDGETEPAPAVYLTLARAPAGGRIEAYDRADGTATETWRTPCGDLDLLEARQAASGPPAGWRVAQAERDRTPAAIRFSLQPEDGSAPVDVAGAGNGSGGLQVALTRGDTGRRPTEGRSLLFDDIPMPEGADARQLATDVPDDWAFRETYTLAQPDPGLAAAWFQGRMANFGWKFERYEPPDSNSAQVHYSAGEEVLLTFSANPTLVVISRRRDCPTGDPVPPGSDAGTATHLLEMPVYPAAVPEGYAAPIETYQADCARLDLIVGWYNAKMAEGNWALAGQEEPTQRRRELLYVRPDEIGLPHQDRTAWARVAVERTWPYRYRIELQRDPMGIREPTPVRRRGEG
jgi:hypothetical protein